MKGTEGLGSEDEGEGEEGGGGPRSNTATEGEFFEYSGCFGRMANLLSGNCEKDKMGSSSDEGDEYSSDGSEDNRKDNR